MDNIKNYNNYKTLRTYNPNILNSDRNCNSIENFDGAFSISSAVRYPLKNRPCDQVGIEGFSTTCGDAQTELAIEKAALNREVETEVNTLRWLRTADEAQDDPEAEAKVAAAQTCQGTCVDLKTIGFGPGLIKYVTPDGRVFRYGFDFQQAYNLYNDACAIVNTRTVCCGDTRPQAYRDGDLLAGVICPRSEALRGHQMETRPNHPIFSNN